MEAKKASSQSSVSFKELSEREVISLAKSCPNSLFEDKDFPPSPSSLFINPSQPAHPPSHVAAWKRPSEIDPGAQLFVDGASSGDVCQGALGDCWFIGALAVIATRTDLLQNLIVSTHPELGFYQFRFWKIDRWITVTIDDRLPCTAANIPIYAHCADKREMWVALFEKAYAKLHGSYEALSGGSIAYAFVDMSGGAAEKINFQNLVAQGKLWDALQTYLKEAWLMGSALSMDGKTEGDNGKGILLKHAYSLLDAQEVDGTKLVHLRNPWGNTDWRGAWSDSDSRWTPQLLKRLNHTLNGDDGDFWMSLQDYSTNFNRIYLCRLYNDSIGDIWHRNQLNLEWKGKTAGGCMNNRTWIYNPQFALRPKVNTPVFISLMQNDTRMNGLPSSDIGVYLLETQDSNVPKTEPSNIIASSGTFGDDREATLSAELLGGHQYVGFGCTFDPRFESKYIITVYTKEPCDVYVITDKGAVLDKADPFDHSMQGSGVVLQPGNPFYQEKKDHSNRASKPPKKYRERPPVATSSTATPTRPAASSSTPSRVTPASPSPAVAMSTSTQTVRPVPQNEGKKTTTPTTSVTTTSKKIVVKRPETVSDPSSVQTVKLSNGDQYNGQISGGKKHGVGSYRFHSGDVYTGTFVDDEQEGEGEYAFASGDRYVGELKKSKFDGYGTYYYRNGDVYEGEFKGGVRHGVGTFKHVDGTLFKGHYQNGIKEGYGVSTFPDGNRYEGEYKNGKPNGTGAYYFSNGSIYRGKFKDDQFDDDEAVYEAPNGDVFVGSYRRGARNGKGTLKSARGFTYTGDWKDNKMDGKGEYLFSTGDKYIGEFHNNEFNGQGVYYHASGEKTEGQFRNGKPVK